MTVKTDVYVCAYSSPVNLLQVTDFLLESFLLKVSMSDPTLVDRQSVVTLYLHHFLCGRGTSKCQTLVLTLVALPHCAVWPLQCAHSTFVIPTTGRWACCARQQIPVEAIMTGFNEVNGSMAGVPWRWTSIQDWAAMTRLSSPICLMPDLTLTLLSIILKARSEMQVFPKGLERKPATTGEGKRQKSKPCSHHLVLPITHTSPDGPRKHCHSSSKIHLHCCLLLPYPSEM